MPELEPLAAASRLAGRDGRVLLHSGAGHDGCGRYSFVACEPRAVVTARGREVVVREGGRVSAFSGDPLAVLEELAAAAGHRDEVGAGEPPVPVAIGMLGYGLAGVVEPRVAARAAAEGGALPPDLWFGLYGAVWRFDRRRGAGEIVGADARARRRLAEALARPAPREAPIALGALAPAPGADARYRDGFDRILRYLRAGDVYQVNLARRLAAPIRRDGDALSLYRAVCRRSPSAYGALLEAGEVRVVSASPERFLFRRPGSRRLETRPIKGTRRRDGDADHARAAELLSDPKERAEHLMIVDLERNDLGRVAEIGSVRVESLGRVVPLPGLYHAVSTVSCRVRTGVSTADILRATFPGGSITGAPKVRAMEIIAEVEPAPRGPYTGAIGYLGAGGALDLSIAIRTAVLADGELSLHVGGGVVADSSLARELEETEEKAAGWRAALALARRA